MTKERTHTLLENLDPVVASFETNSFSLADDLAHLMRVWEVKAPEAVVLYCSRLVEALADVALRVVKLEPSTNLFSNLEVLSQYNLIPASTGYWAHALRRTGNLVRHVRVRVQTDEAELAILLVEQWLRWYFTDFRYGPMRVSLTRDRRPILSGGDDRLRDVFAAIDGAGQQIDRLVQTTPIWLRDELLRTSTLPAVVAEMLLNSGHPNGAEEVLRLALGKYPGDLRLCQLLGLFWSRSGNLENALECLEPLHLRYREDDETAGILAGVYKRLWFRNRAVSTMLHKARQLYERGWERQRRPMLTWASTQLRHRYGQCGYANPGQLRPRCSTFWTRGVQRLRALKAIQTSF
jgi:hypothetical protein